MMILKLICKVFFIFLVTQSISATPVTCTEKDTFAIKEGYIESQCNSIIRRTALSKNTPQHIYSMLKIHCLDMEKTIIKNQSLKQSCHNKWSLPSVSPLFNSFRNLFVRYGIFENFLIGGKKFQEIENKSMTYTNFSNFYTSFCKENIKKPKLKISQKKDNEIDSIISNSSHEKINSTIQYATASNQKSYGDIQKVQNLCREFKQGLFIRTFDKEDEEVTNMINPKVAIYGADGLNQTSERDPNYWNSSSTIMEGLKVPVWLGEGQHRTGLFLSSNVEMAFWGCADLGTPNYGQNKTKEEISNAASRFSIAAIEEMLNIKTDDNIVNLIFDDIFNNDYDITNVPDVFLKTSLKKILKKEITDDDLKKIKTVYTVEDAFKNMTLMKEYKQTPYSIYSEAKIHYKPNDILGVFFDLKDEKSKEKALSFNNGLKSKGINVPIVSYSLDSGISIFNNEKDLKENKPTYKCQHDEEQK